MRLIRGDPAPRLLVRTDELPDPPPTDQLRRDRERVADAFGIPRWVLGLEPPPDDMRRAALAEEWQHITAAADLGAAGCPGIDGPFGEEPP